MAKYNQGIAGARATRRLYIVNGSELVTATKQQAFLPCADEVLSGQPVARKSDTFGTKFVKATSADKSATIYWATADSTDMDVLAAGKLGAIYTGDKFEIQTPFFAEDTYAPGDKLVINEDGLVAKGTTAGSVIGIVSAGVIDFGSVEPVGVKTVGENEYIQGGPSAWVNDTGSQKVLQFYTVAE